MDKPKNDIVYFWLNDWDHPNDSLYIGWMIRKDKPIFLDEEWVKENKLCVIVDQLYMDMYVFITATREWVENNCPSILNKYNRYLSIPDGKGKAFTPLYGEYKTYSKENIGISWIPRRSFLSTAL